MRIAIITYNYNHLKTEQIITNLVQFDYEIVVYALPFFKRQEREILFQHRPNQFNATHPKDVAKLHSIPYYVCNSDLDIQNGFDYYLITGAGILSKDCVFGKKIINCHPGIIPLSRGLDSFKWAIYDNVPVGNTLHFINEEVDSGKIIFQEFTPVFPNDTIDSFALRHYNNEIEILSNFNKHLLSPRLKNLTYSEGCVHKRMPIHIEKELNEKFEEYKKTFMMKGD